MTRPIWENMRVQMKIAENVINFCLIMDFAAPVPQLFHAYKGDGQLEGLFLLQSACSFVTQSNQLSVNMA